MSAPFKIVSGGQTGADRAALDFAIERGIPHGGWCPRSRRAEDGVIPERYQLQETPLANSVERTEWNVRDSDGTVIFSLAPGLSGGSAKTLDLALCQRKPVLHLARNGNGNFEQQLTSFIYNNGIRVLNVAGPPESHEPGIADFVKEVLSKAMAPGKPV